LVWVKKAKNPRLTGNRGFLKNILLNQNFTPTTPKRRQTRVQMDMRPLVCACFSVGANVLFIFNRQEETPLGRICQKFFISKSSLSQGLSDGEVVLNWFKHERTTTNGHLRVV
jgi:hypothetical protein